MATGLGEVLDDKPVEGVQPNVEAVPVTDRVVFCPAQILTSADAVTVGKGLTVAVMESDKGHDPPDT